MSGVTAQGTDRLSAWERVSAAPLTVLSVLFLVVYAVPILRPDLSPAWRAACAATTVTVWLLFWADIIVRLRLATDRRRFVREHLFDLVVLALPMLRPLRAVRLIMVVLTINRRTEVWARGRLAVYVAATTALLVLVSALAVLDAERPAPDANIASFDDALWWSTVTITTVGYGDFYPVTMTGRFVALGLMIGGIGLIGFVTGSLATWIVERVSAGADKPATATATSEDVAALRAEIAALRRRLDADATERGAG
ncbi:voltage-gated potassium channel [Micromonospora phaseoli]|uniref:Voltage-gated potassium channel n=1 Tax=Micromonospora phaseoli TaxID=1144548 RepID=A0A1H7AHQ9_9ACTN|nr:potassium channel family protein [Micromonospora phaseoli]PZV96452.1 voltage-gated potassium channel [Micromonospora phaseoli]GIJ76140.1 ion transporter [Micromonospora phaseoli]SEJ63427.1 voltage-gated potassium channel [Micromonospora phaseoli]